MVVKRKHIAFEESQQGDVVAKPPPGTQTFTSGAAVRDALAQGSRQAFVAFHQQILTARSALPVPITHPTATILQHYQSVSPTFEEIFSYWKESDRTRNEKGTESAVALLVQIIDILAGIPFFRTAVLGLVQKLIAQNEPYPDLINRLIQSGKRDQVLLGLQLAASAVQVDLPDPSSPGYGSGRLALKMWNVVAEGGSAKILGKVLGMRRRNKEGTIEYGSKDPLDRPDIRHAALHFVIPLFPLAAFHAVGKSILPAIYNNMRGDPPITIYRILTGLWAAIAGPSAGIARRTALALIDENALEKLLDLVNREDEDPISGKTVGDMTMAFLEATTTVPGQGICFKDQGWYPRQGTDVDEVEEELGSYNKRRDEGRMRKGLHNRILSNVVRKLGSRVIEDQGRIGDWVVKVLRACPEIVAGYWPHSALALEPRLNARWLATMAYVGRIVSLPPPDMSTFHQSQTGDDSSAAIPRPNPPSVSIMIESIFPSPLGKVHLSKGLQNSDLLVQHVTALALARGLQKLVVVQQILEEIEAEIEAQPGSSDNTSVNAWTKRRMELEIECKRRVPEILVIISFAQKSATLARIPADSDDEPDPKLVAKSALLTEVALRLFGLYQTALPSVSREAKFDVGKLLVSSSSAKAERKEKREAREGSVISDTGSVGSVGTIGTVGMGGGFGQSRGDVDGFEAMSQVHVLSLLTQVQDWQWTNKASGSQYSYLYHILLLHLSTPHPITKRMTTNLLRKLLLPTLMFEHDAGELEIWLSALPELSTLKDPSQRAWLVVQQIHLLSFLDECVRRCMKTPYKYIDDVMAVIPDYFEPMRRPHELVSPLLMTVLEQLRAKLNGQLIATDAAGTVIAYLRRVMLGLTGKVASADWLLQIGSKMEAMVKEAREKGQERRGLLGNVEEVINTIATVFDGKTDKLSEEPAVKMIDEAIWTEGSFEEIANQSGDMERLSRLLAQASPPAVERYGRYLLHLWSSGSGSKDHFLDLIRQALEFAQGDCAYRLRSNVFLSPTMKEALKPRSETTLSRAPKITLDQVDGLVATLEESDEGWGELYVSDLVQYLRDETRNLSQALGYINPWTRFFHPAAAKEAVVIVAERPNQLSNPSARVADTVSRLIIATQDPWFALERLHVFVDLGILRPFVELLRASSLRREQALDLSGLVVGGLEIKRILDTDSPEAYELVRTLAELSPPVLRTVVLVLSGNSALLSNPSVLLIVQSIMEVSEVLSDSIIRASVNTAVNVMSTSSASRAEVDAAHGVLRMISKQNPTLIIDQLKVLKLSAYNHEFAILASELSRSKDIVQGVRYLVHLGLQYLTRIFSSDKKLEGHHLAAIESLGKSFTFLLDPYSYSETAVKNVDDISLDLETGFVEPLITAVVQERLSVPQASSFAAVLVGKSTMKASFIRQHLSLLLSSSVYNVLASPISGPSHTARAGFVALLSALFGSNPYMTCQPNHVEQLLPLYQGTMSESDQKILTLFQLFESYRHISVASVFSAWSATAGRSSRPFEALTSLEPNRTFATALAFPLRRAIRDVQITKENDRGQGIYDPVFVLTLFAAVLRGDLTGLDWVEILRTNVLGVAVTALSSRDAQMRNLGGYVLARTMKALEGVAFQEKPQLVYILRLLRYSIAPPEGSQTQPRLPVLISTFLAHTLRSLASPSNPLYPAASRFLLQRHKLDIADVPMLFTMLYASGEGHKRDRNFIVRFIRDATRSEADWRLLKRRKTVELLETLYSSSLDVTFRRLILQALERITLLPPTALSLVHRGFFVTWLSTQWAKSKVSRRGAHVEEERGRYLAILENLVIVLVQRDFDRKSLIPSSVDHDEKDRAKSEERRLDWMLPVNRLLKQAMDGSDIERLAIVVKIVLRLSKVEGSKTATELLPKLVERLVVLHPKVEGDEQYNDILEKLFESSLTITAGDQRVQEAVEEIGWGVRSANTPLGNWVRREHRQAVWEK